MDLKTPGVYIVEKNAFPNSVVEVASAVPAFVGYTEAASNKGQSLRGKPWRISSMAEYTQVFGGLPKPRLRIEALPTGTPAPAIDMVNIRRTVSVVEESCRLAMRAYVFEPNDANTWTTLRSMLGNYLTSLWKRGGLMGSTPDDAYAVQCGLGQTMTAQDMLDGTLRATVLLAVVRPAEFIVVTFEQKQQAA